MNGKENESFKYAYAAPTAEERREIEGIRRQYTLMGEGPSKMLRLKKLDSAVKNGAKAIALIVGIVGCLLFGLGFSMILVWRLTAGGVVVCVLGAMAMAVAYPLFKRILKRNRDKHREEILSLSEELLHEKGNDEK